MNIQIDTSRQPVVFSKGGEVFASSRDVAEYFGKQHRHVLRDIDQLLVQEPKLALSNFGQGSYTTAETYTQQHRLYEMDRTGFTLLAMGFTGAKALKWKLRYIEAFEAMEAEVRRIADAPAVNLNDPSQLRALLLNYSEQAERLERRVEELLPSQEALNRISTADGSLCVTDAAKALQIRPKDLFSWLSQNGWIYKRPGAAHYLGYQDKTAAALLEHKVTTVLRADGSEKITEQVRITPKGLAKLAAKITPPLLVH